MGMSANVDTCQQVACTQHTDTDTHTTLNIPCFSVGLDNGLAHCTNKIIIYYSVKQGDSALLL